MDIISKAKEWVTLNEAASILSRELKQDISIGDIYHLAFNKRLNLSFITTSTTVGCIVYEKQADEIFQVYKEIVNKHTPKDDKSLFEKLIESDLAFTILPTEDALYKPVGRSLLEAGRPYYLAMIGNERLDIENSFYQEVKIQSPEYINIDGFFIKDGQKILSVKEKLNGEDIPASGIDSMEYASYVCTIESIESFLASYSTKKENTDIHPREEASLLLILAAVCKMNPFNPSERGRAKGVRIELQQLGIDMSEDTIRKYLKQIGDVLDRRKT
ncbi:hypothetical protein L0B52_01130 [Suttonella sp. R2A3]|uniref:hypothetical protein n=1 Tax=Suttonella sp. R2A3 TaxID=2908648 RepID=UPI001F19D7EC|nr:hypothetical protein [Suttonella sp. R2A3]UJF24769.1 hypothetical protein L0B52_01130 [Suttonella sp. R2A3]